MTERFTRRTAPIVCAWFLPFRSIFEVADEQGAISDSDRVRVIAVHENGVHIGPEIEPAEIPTPAPRLGGE